MHELEKAGFRSPHPVPLPAGEGTIFLPTAGACRDRFFRPPLRRIAGESEGVCTGQLPGTPSKTRGEPGFHSGCNPAGARLRSPSACHLNASSEYPVTRGLMPGKVRWFSPCPRDNAEVAETQGSQRPMPDVAADHPTAGGDGHLPPEFGWPIGPGSRRVAPGRRPRARAGHGMAPGVRSASSAPLRLCVADHRVRSGRQGRKCSDIWNSYLGAKARFITNFMQLSG